MYINDFGEDQVIGYSARLNLLKLESRLGNGISRSQIIKGLLMNAQDILVIAFVESITKIVQSFIAHRP